MSKCSKHPNQIKHQFKKGNKASPGRPPLPEEIRKAAKISNTQFQGIFHKFSLMDYKEFIRFVNKESMNVAERIIAVVMVKALRGDDRSASLIWDRMMGRVKEKIEVELPKPMVIQRPNGNQIELGHQETIDVTPEEKKK